MFFAWLDDIQYQWGMVTLGWPLNYIPLYTSRSSHVWTMAYVQWEFQAIFCGDIPLHRPYICLIYGRYLQSRILKWPLICDKSLVSEVGSRKPWPARSIPWIRHSKNTFLTPLSAINMEVSMQRKMWRARPVDQWRMVQNGEDVKCEDDDT